MSCILAFNLRQHVKLCCLTTCPLEGCTPSFMLQGTPSHTSCWKQEASDLMLLIEYNLFGSWYFIFKFRHKILNITKRVSLINESLFLFQDSISEHILLLLHQLVFQLYLLAKEILFFHLFATQQLHFWNS